MKSRWSVLAIAALLALPVKAGDLPEQDRARIEYLLQQLGQMRDATFIRNDKSYPAETAATFLRRKWESRASSVTNVSAFITQVATLSSTSGKPYTIRFPDGSVTNCGDYLRFLLTPHP